MNKTPQGRLLIYRLGSLGDAVVALPALHLIARAFPTYEKRLLTNLPIASRAAPLAEVLEGSGLIDGHLSYRIGLRNPLALTALARQIRDWDPEIVVYLAAPRGIISLIRDTAFFLACGTRRILGVPWKLSERRHRLLNGGNLHLESEASRLVRCLKPLGNANLDDPAFWELNLRSEEHAMAVSQLVDLGADHPFFAISTGTKLAEKHWGLPNWRALLLAMRQRYKDVGLVLVGAAAEREQMEQLRALWLGPSINLCGSLRVRETAAVLSRAAFFVGHDSGPMHLSAAVGTPCVAIFSLINKPGVWHPHGPGHFVLSPSSSGVHRLAKGLSSISTISVERVAEGIDHVARTKLVNFR
jgi:heptosyltransferase III